LIKDKIHFVVFDRSGAISTQGFNIHSNPEIFIRIIVATLYLNSVQLGEDPTIKLNEDGKTGHLYFKGDKYIITEILYVEGVVRGRGTVCYRVHRDKEDPFQDNEELIVKDSWVDTSRKDTEAKILRILNAAGVRGVPTLIDDEVVQFDGVPDSTFRARASFFLDGKWASKEDKEIEIREHRRILMKPFGRKLEGFKTLLGFVTAIRDVAD
ncbi:hypothetical protein SCHPADRAFT_788511, partial [Schizopora paradoxa]